MSDAPLLVVDDLRVGYRLPQGRSHVAVDGVGFTLQAGETLGLVGESGCGKSTLARALLGLVPIDGGRVSLEGVDLDARDAATLRRLRTRMHLIFQDPTGSLNPRRRVRELVAEPMAIAGTGDAAERERRVRAALEAVGLTPARMLDRRPHECSGGQCQRIAIARALVAAPRLLICDEPVSALDVSVRARILDLLEALKARHGFAMLFIGHDLAAVRHVSDRVAVMRLGRLCELGPAATIFQAPMHPYTAALVSAVPTLPPRLPRLRAEAGPTPADDAPSDDALAPADPPDGCRFRARCPRATARCAQDVPSWREAAPGRFVACHHPLPAG